MFQDKAREIEYWSARLSETEKNTQPILTSYHLQDFRLSHEETYTLVRLAQDFASYSRLLEECVNRPDPAPSKKFWHRKK